VMQTIFAVCQVCRNDQDASRCEPQARGFHTPSMAAT
jgi:hypothetical protein